MESKLKFKTTAGTEVQLPFDPAFPVVIEVISADKVSSVTVKDPTGVSSTQEWVGGMKKR